MKLKSSLVGFSLVTLLALTGCTSQPSAEEVAASGSQDPNVCYEGGVEAPNWLCDPTIEGGMGAVGSAPKTPLGRGFQQTEAMANARDQLAREMGTKVKNMFKSFAQSTGVGENQSIEKVATNVSKQVSKQNIVGAVQKNRWQSPDGTLFLHVALEKDAIQSFVEETKNIVKTSLRNDEALYQQFQAKKAMEELEKEIEKEMTGN
jgi:ribosomal protein S20